MVRRVMFLPDGRLASAGGSWIGSEFGEVKIWDLSTGRVLDLSGHTQMVQALASSPDGRRLVTGSLDFTIKLWDTSTGQERCTLAGHKGAIKALRFSPNGTVLAGPLIAGAATFGYRTAYIIAAGICVAGFALIATCRPPHASTPPKKSKARKKRMRRFVRPEPRLRCPKKPASLVVCCGCMS